MDPKSLRLSETLAGSCFAIGATAALTIGGVIYAVSHDAILAVVFGVFFLIIPLILVGFHVRARVAESYYTLEVRPPTEALRLGQSFEFSAVVLPKRNLVLGTGKLTLRCQEHAISRGGTSDTHYRQTLFEQVFDLPPGRRYQRGEALEIRQRLTIPATGVPSFDGKNNFIEWSVVLQVPARGICPDIHEQSPLRVLPQIIAAADEPMGEDTMLPRNWGRSAQYGEEVRRQGSVTAEFWNYQGPTLKGLPVVPVGGSRRLQVRVTADGDVHCRGVLACVCCRIHGAGSSEEIVLSPEQTIHMGDFPAGANAERAYDIKVPETGPVSFVGRYVKCDWEIRVRVDIPIWRDRRLHLPFLVTPQLLSVRD